MSYYKRVKAQFDVDLLHNFCKGTGKFVHSTIGYVSENGHVKIVI